MTGFLIKLIMCPLILYLTDYISPAVNYGSVYQPLILGLILAVAAHLLEVYLLEKGTLWVSTLADFVAASFIVYFGTLLLPEASITFGGALLAAGLLTVAEYYLHLYLIRTGKTQKSG